MQQTMRLPRRCYRCMSHRLPALMQQCYVMASRRAHTSVTRTACCIGCRAVSHAAPIAHRLPSTCPLHLVKARCIGCRLTRRTHFQPSGSALLLPTPQLGPLLQSMLTLHPRRGGRGRGAEHGVISRKKNQRREGRGRRSRATRRKRRNQRARRSLRSTSCQRVLMQGEAS